MRSASVKAIESVYVAFARGDVPAVLGALSGDIEWTEAMGFPYGGTYHGPSAVFDGVFIRLATEWEGFAAVPDEFIDGGDTVVALGLYGGRFKATGKSFSARFAHVWKVRDGRAYRFEQFVDTLRVDEALR